MFVAKQQLSLRLILTTFLRSSQHSQGFLRFRKSLKPTLNDCWMSHWIRKTSLLLRSAPLASWCPSELRESIAVGCSYPSFFLKRFYSSNAFASDFSYFLPITRKFVFTFPKDFSNLNLLPQSRQPLEGFHPLMESHWLTRLSFALNSKGFSASAHFIIFPSNSWILI